MIGKKLANRYEITGELGRGGMGVVYRARDPVLERDVAVKVAPASLDAAARARLRREATVVAQMDHPSIVTVHDMGEDGDSLFFVMPVVPGANLRTRLAEGTLRIDDVLDIGQQIAEGLDYSHHRGVLHRDVKPENIMVERDPDGRVRARIMDFGLAWTGFETRLTKTGSLIGTIAYLSPEQVSDNDIDERTDVYSLAVVLYECFAGAPPFSGETHAMLYRIVYEKPMTLRSAGVEIDDDVDAFLAKCLAKAPRDRPAGAAEMAARLAELRGGGDAGAALLPPVREAPLRGPVEAPFVGRESELAALRACLDAATDGECQLVVVRGDAGTGKTRLVDELDRLARARDVRVLRGRFSGQERDLPFNGFCEVIQDFFRMKEVSPSSTGLPDLTDLAGELLASFPMLGEITFLREAAASGAKPVDASRDGGRTELFELIARALARLGGGKPLVVVLEDLHQASISAEAIPYVVRRLAPTPTLILATYCRTEADARHPIVRMVDTMANSSEFTMLDLEPLTVSQIATLLARIAGEDVDPALAERIHASTDGNPLFAQELFRSLEESDDLVSTDGGIRLRRDVSVITGELPATLRQAVERRIERLSAELSDLLATASVIGRSFDYRELERLAHDDHPALDDQIDRLIEEGLLREERETRGDRLAFVSGIVREAVYATLTRRKKRVLHRRLGELLEGRSDAGEKNPGRLMFHFARADDAERAIRYGLAAAQRALDAFSVDEALEHVGVVLEFVDDEDVRDSRGNEGEAWRLAALAHRQRRDVQAMLRAVGRSVSAHAREGLHDRALTSMVLGARTAWEHRLVEPASEWSKRAVEVAERSGEPDDRRDAFLLASTIANLRGHHQDAAALRDRALRVGAPQAVDAEDRSGGRLVVGMTTELDEFDPASALTAEEDEVLANVFETLLATDDHGELAPRLCERWEVVESGRAVVLHLRRGVLFHDGEPLDAGVVKRSLEAALHHSFGRARMALAAVFNVEGRKRTDAGRIPDLAGIVVQDEHCLRIRLGRPFPVFPRLLTSPAMAVARRCEGRLPVGTGRFGAVEVTRHRVVVRAREAHWSGAVPRVDEVEFRLGLDPEELLSSLGSGTIDLGRQLPVEGIEHLVNDPGAPLRIVDSPKKNVYFVLFATTGTRQVPEPVRRAMVRGVRLEKIVRETLGRFAEPASGLIPPGILGHDAGMRRQSPLGAATARDLVASGWEGATPVDLDAAIHPVFTGRYARLLDRLLEAWTALGIRIRNVTPSMTAFLRAAQSGEFVHLLIGRWTADYDDPDNFTHGLFHSLDGSFRGFWTDAELDRLGEEGRRETDPVKRDGIYRRYVDVLTREGVVLPLFHDNDLGLLGRRVRRVRMTGSAPYVDYGSLEVRDTGRGPAAVDDTGTRTLHVPAAGSISSTDPARAWTSTAFEILPNVYETLTRVSHVGGLRPWLAASFESNADGTVHRFSLRDDVRFHDGRRLTVRDVRYTFERVLRNPSNRIDVLSCIRGARELMNAEAILLEGFEVLSTTEFALHLVEPVRVLPLALSSPTVAIVPDGAVPRSKGGEGLVGTGPFRVDHFEPGRMVELSAHTDYWRDRRPRSRRLVFELDARPGEIVEAFRAAHFAVASDLRIDDLDELRRDSAFAAGHRETPGLATAFLALNSHAGLLARIETRRRVLAALDAEGLVADAVTRPWSPASGLFPPELKGVEGSRRTTRIPRPAENDEATLSLTLAFPRGSDDTWERLAAAIAARLAEAGIAIELVGPDLTEYFRRADEGSVDLVIGRWHATYPDCDSFAHGLLDSRYGALRALSSSPELDRLVEIGRREADPLQRNDAYQRIEDLLARQSLLLPLFHPQVCRIARPDLRGLRLALGRPAIAYEELVLR